MEKVEDLFIGDKQVPSLPEVYFAVKAAIEDPDCTHEDVAEIISQDPGLSVRLLKVVNSAFFGFANKIETISHAAGIVGMDQLHNLVVSTVIVDQFKGIKSNYVSMRAFWEHSILCGIAARILASHKEEDDLERFFIAGLLHDIGRLILCMTVPEKVEESVRLSFAEDFYLHKAERLVIGFDHSKVGAYILEQWDLPLIHQEVASFHHTPGAAELNLEVSIVHAADFLANNSGVGNGGETFIPPINNRALEIIGVKKDDLMGPILEKALGEFQEAGQAFLATV